MVYSLIPKNFLSFDDLIPMPSNQNGLSISEDDKKIYVEVAMPGISSKDVDITFHDGYLWVRGDSKKEEEDKKKKYYKKAISSFSYQVTVPSDVDIKKDPEATCKNGIVTIAFDKSPKTQPKKILVK